MIVNWFLVILAGIWLIVASIWDLKKREVPNWLNFSLVIFALTYRAFYAAANSNWMFFAYGVLGFAVFFVLAYALYYGRVFAGGDAKLLMGLGAVIPFANTLSGNIWSLLLFVSVSLFAGGIYGIFYSAGLAWKNWEKFSKEFSRQMTKRRKFIFISRVFAILSFIIVIIMKEAVFFVFPVILFSFSYMLVYAKAIEESCMIIFVRGKEVTIGDWLAESVKTKSGVIEPYWQGLSEKDVNNLKNKQKVKIKQGIPFVPAFLIGFVLFIFFREFLLGLFPIF